MALVLRRLPPGKPTVAAPHGDAAARHVLVLAVSGALGMAAGNSLGSFFVEFAVSSGINVGDAGLWLAVGVVLALSPWPALLAVTTFIAFATAWGWPGLMLYTVVRLRRETPAASTGVVLAGTFVGGAGGPVLFGTLVEQASYQVAWLAAALLLVLAAGCAWIARRLLVADLAHRRCTLEAA